MYIHTVQLICSKFDLVKRGVGGKFAFREKGQTKNPVFLQKQKEQSCDYERSDRGVLGRV